MLLQRCQLTVCVNGGWENQLPKRKSAKVQNKTQKRAESQPSGARFVSLLGNDVLFNDSFSPVVSCVTVHFCFLGCRLLAYSAGFVWNRASLGLIGIIHSNPTGFVKGEGILSSGAAPPNPRFALPRVYKSDRIAITTPAWLVLPRTYPIQLGHFPTLRGSYDARSVTCAAYCHRSLALWCYCDDAANLLDVVLDIRERVYLGDFPVNQTEKGIYPVRP